MTCGETGLYGTDQSELQTANTPSPTPFLSNQPLAETDKGTHFNNTTERDLPLGSVISSPGVRKNGYTYQLPSDTPQTQTRFLSCKYTFLCQSPSGMHTCCCTCECVEKNKARRPCSSWFNVTQNQHKITSCSDIKLMTLFTCLTLSAVITKSDWACKSIQRPSWTYFHVCISV